MAARLGALLLRSTPYENDYDRSVVKEAVARNFSQRSYLRAVQGPMGRRALAALQHRLEQHVDMLRKRSHEDPIKSLHRDQDMEDLCVGGGWSGLRCQRCIGIDKHASPLPAQGNRHGD